MENLNNPGSGNDQSGSLIGNAPANPNNFGSTAGQANNSADQVDYKKLYEELEPKIGSQGRELGEYRSFFEGIAPLLDKLDKSPELVQAIIDGSVDENLAKAALKGEINIKTAEVITTAHTEVKKELGTKEYAKTSAEDIAKMVEDRVAEVKKELKLNIDEVEEARSFEQSVNEFIDRTADFADYAGDVERWLDRHPDVTDIEVAYYAVKGQLSTKEAAQRADADRAEYEKNLAANAGGGQGGVSGFPEGVNPIDVLVAGKSNPNVFS